jgi:chromate transport protein ChrA
VSTDPQREAPPVGEQIHIPGPSAIPLLTAVGITIALVGVTTTWFLSIAGGILTLWCIVRWVRDTRRDISELPPRH